MKNELNPERENETLKKFKRWEKHLSDLQLNLTNTMDEEKTLKIESYMDKIESNYINKVSKLVSKLKDSKENKKINLEKLKENIFWDKNTKTDKV